MSEKTKDLFGFLHIDGYPTFEDCVKERARANGRSMTTEEARQMVSDINRKCEEMKMEKKERGKE